MQEYKYALGTQIKHRNTPFKGIIVQACMYITGCTKYEVRANTKSTTTIPTTYWVSEGEIEAVGTCKSSEVVSHVAWMGDTVKDTVTGFTGVVTAYAEMDGSCPQYAVTLKKKWWQSQKDVTAVWFDEGRIELLKIDWTSRATVYTVQDRKGAGAELPVRNCR